jgi:xanthine dehydrogenase accessory factor
MIVNGSATGSKWKGRALSLSDLVVVLKGAGDVATGIAVRLFMSNITRVLMTEIPAPLCVRRSVSFSEAVYEGAAEVEGIKAELIGNLDDPGEVWGRRHVAVAVDQDWTTVGRLKPHVVIDAIMAKKNIGTKSHEAPLVIGIGPGFVAPRDVHVAVESNRGHNLGRTIYKGSTEMYTGVPGSVMGYTVERVLRSPIEGWVKNVKKIGDEVRVGEVVLYVGDEPVFATFDGILRGLIREIEVEAGEKVADVDPRGIKENCYTVSDKARAIGGGVLEAILHLIN